MKMIRSIVGLVFIITGGFGFYFISQSGELLEKELPGSISIPLVCGMLVVA